MKLVLLSAFFQLALVSTWAHDIKVLPQDYANYLSKNASAMAAEEKRQNNLTKEFFQSILGPHQLGGSMPCSEVLITKIEGLDQYLIQLKKINISAVTVSDNKHLHVGPTSYLAIYQGFGLDSFGKTPNYRLIINKNLSGKLQSIKYEIFAGDDLTKGKTVFACP
jgi:hypothetical protein